MTEGTELFDAIAAGDADAVDAAVARTPSALGADLDGVSPVRHALYHRHDDLAAHLRALGAPLDVFDAAALGDTDALRAMLDADAGAVDRCSGDGFTALHLAAWFGHPRTAELLLGRGADPEAVATNGTLLRPLHSAAAGGHAQIAHLLLDRGADIEACQRAGVRALHAAAHRNDTTMVRLLLDRGADPTAATDDGQTPAELATDDDVRALLPPT